MVCMIKNKDHELIEAITLYPNSSNKVLKRPPAVPELYGPYDSYWRQILPNDLARGTPYVFGAHTPHDHPSYGVRYQFDWGDGQQQNFDFGWPDPGMPNPSHSWSSIGEKIVKVRARYYNPDNTNDYSNWSAWNSITVIVKE